MLEHISSSGAHFFWPIHMFSPKHVTRCLVVAPWRTLTGKPAVGGCARYIFIPSFAFICSLNVSLGEPMVQLLSTAGLLLPSKSYNPHLRHRDEIALAG